MRTIVLSILYMLVVGCEPKPLAAKKLSQENTQTANNETEIAKEKDFTLAPTLIAGAPCHSSQTSFVAYDMENKSFIFCNSTKWKELPLPDGFATTHVTQGSEKGYRLLDKSSFDQMIKKKQARQPLKRSKWVGTSQAPSKDTPKSFKCRSVKNKTSFHCKPTGSQTLQLAH